MSPQMQSAIFQPKIFHSIMRHTHSRSLTLYGDMYSHRSHPEGVICLKGKPLHLRKSLCWFIQGHLTPFSYRPMFLYPQCGEHCTMVTVCSLECHRRLMQPLLPRGIAMQPLPVVSINWLLSACKYLTYLAKIKLREQMVSLPLYAS